MQLTGRFEAQVSTGEDMFVVYRIIHDIDSRWIDAGSPLSVFLTCFYTALSSGLDVGSLLLSIEMCEDERDAMAVLGRPATTALLINTFGTSSASESISGSLVWKRVSKRQRVDNGAYHQEVDNEKAPTQMFV